MIINLNLDYRMNKIMSVLILLFVIADFFDLDKSQSESWPTNKLNTKIFAYGIVGNYISNS